LEIRSQVELAARTTLGVGGRARYFAEVTSDAELEDALAFADREHLPVYVLGGGSNLVIGEGELRGLVISIALRGVQLRDTPEGAIVEARAGEPWDALVERTVALGLRGLECLSGIPGLVGATPIQNVGAYGQEIADTLLAVRAFDRATGRYVTIAREHAELSYRNSRFKSRERDRFVVTDVSFALERGAPGAIRYPELARTLAALERPPTLADVRDHVLALRRSKSMVWDPEDANGRSCGSFFVNPITWAEQALAIERRFAPTPMPRYAQPDGRVKLSAAWLIERSGFSRGTRAGNVGLSSRHALAIVCHDGATANEVLRFAERIRAQVEAQTGVTLEPEPVFWGSPGPS
jgi:UDP-N-acetylmuramate dehydrogenase